MKESTNKRIKKALKITVNVLLYTFFAVCVVALFISLLSKRDSDGAVDIFGYQLRVVVSPSMEKCEHTDVSEFKIKDIPVRSMIFVQLIPKDEDKQAEWYSEIKPGDVLTFKYLYSKQETITHRVVSIDEDGKGGYIIILEGDNKNDETGALQQIIYTSDEASPNYVIGKVTGQSKFLGFIVFVISQPLGLALIIIVPCLIIIIFEVIRVVNVIHASKKSKLAEQNKNQQTEIDELKRQLEEMKKQNSDSNEDAEK